MRRFILVRYIIREHLGPFCFSFAVITLVFLLDLLFRYLNRLLSKGLPLGLVLEFFVLNLAWIIATAAPMAVLTASLMAFGRLAADQEIAALQSSGISLGKILAPALIGAALLALGLVWFNDNILPDCNLRVRTLAEDIVRKKPTVQIEPGIWYQQIPHFGLLAQALEDSAGRTKARHLLIDDNSKAELRRTISARSGLIQANATKGELMLTLYEGEIQEQNQMKPEEFRRLIFAKHVMVIGAQEGEMTRQETEPRTDREKSIPQMWSEVAQAREEIARLHGQLAQPLAQQAWHEAKLAEVQRLESLVQGLLVEIHKKYAIPAACLVFVLIGAPLGTLARRGGLAAGAGFSLGFFLFYWAGLIGGEVLADRRLLSPILAMWFANIITGILGLGVLRYAINGHASLPALTFIPFVAMLFPKLRWKNRKTQASPDKDTIVRSRNKSPQQEPGEKSKTRDLVPLAATAAKTTALEVITFDVVEPDFVERWQTAPATRQLPATTTGSHLELLREILSALIVQARLALAVISDRNGNVLASAYNSSAVSTEQVDLHQLAKLAATRMAMLRVFGKALNEEGEFTCVFQEGEQNNLFIYQVTEEHVLTVLVNKQVALGLVRLHANLAVKNFKLCLF